MKLWRISNHADLSGAGALRASGRWHSRGRPIVYLADWPACALLEVLVHLEIDALSAPPREFRLIEVGIPAGIRPSRPRLLSDGWRESLEETQAIGDHWLAGARSLLMRVPSAIVPFHANYLFNPLHKMAAATRIAAVHPVPFDARLFRR